YQDEDFVSPRIDPEAKIVSLPRPAGVVLALTPSTNPVCSVYFKIILALLTRNAIVVSPHPMASECCADAARLLAGAAPEGGAADHREQGVRQRGALHQRVGPDRRGPGGRGAAQGDAAPSRRAAGRGRARQAA